MEPGIIVRVIKVGQSTATPSSILFCGDQVKNVFSKSDSQSIRPLLEDVIKVSPFDFRIDIDMYFWQLS